MRKSVLFLFVDGIGLGQDDPETNPFALADLPNLHTLLGERRMLAGSGLPLESERASLLALDACLGVADLPQSATGQSVLLTGQNVPAHLGYHYGPKPNTAVAAFLKQDTIFHRLIAAGKSCALLSGYPPRYFQGIQSGRRLYSAIPLAASQAGIPLLDDEAIRQGLALPADLTGEGWMQQPGFPEIPLRSPEEAGKQLAKLGLAEDFSLFEYWLSDYAGHQQNMDQAVDLLKTFDRMLGGLLEDWQDDQGLILLTSDHGNLEDLGTRRHTGNPVPALLIGSPSQRQQFTRDLKDLTGIAPRIWEFLHSP